MMDRTIFGTILLLVFVVELAQSYGAYHGLTYEERTRCIGDHARCALNKSHLEIFVVGDTGGISIDLTHTIGTYHATNAQTRLSAKMSEMAGIYKPEFFLTVGDNIYWNGVDDKCDKRFETLFEIPFLDARLMRPWYMIGGNHDHLGNIQAQIDYSKEIGKWTFPSLYYKASYSFANGRRTADFIFIDTIVMCGLTVDPDSRSVASWLWHAATNRKPLTGPMPRHVELAKEQWTWLEQQLNQSNADYLFVSSHYPIYSISSHGPTKCLIDKLDPLLKKYGVSAYIAGHDHTLQHFQEENTVSQGRASKMHYVVSGVGSRIDPSESHLTVENSKNLMYRYPKYEDINFWRRTFKTYMIGNGWGGLSRLIINETLAEFIFYAGEGLQQTHNFVIEPRRKKNT